jgi:hypothetical protein
VTHFRRFFFCVRDSTIDFPRTGRAVELSSKQNTNAIIQKPSTNRPALAASNGRLMRQQTLQAENMDWRRPCPVLCADTLWAEWRHSHSNLPLPPDRLMFASSCLPSRVACWFTCEILASLLYYPFTRHYLSENCASHYRCCYIDRWTA